MSRKVVRWTRKTIPSATLVPADAGLVLGVQRRLLPTAIEQVAFAFLTLGELGALSLTSRGLQKAVRHTLQTGTEWTCFSHGRDDAHGLRLLASVGGGDSRLRVLHFKENFTSRAPPYAKPWMELLLCVLANYRMTLEQLIADERLLGDVRVVQILSQCPHIQRLHVQHVGHANVARALLMSGCSLRHLSFGRYSPMDDIWLCPILRNARLETLKIYDVTRDTAVALAGPTIQRLHTVSIEQGGTGLADTDAIGDVLMQAPCLTDLHIKLPGQLCNKTDLRPWRLANLQVLHAQPCNIPPIEAPRLRRLQMYGHCEQLLQQLAKTSPLLETIEQEDSDHLPSPPDDNHIVGRLLASRIVWPHLRVLSMGIMVRLPLVCKALSRYPNLQQVNLRVHMPIAKPHLAWELMALLPQLTSLVLGLDANVLEAATAEAEWRNLTAGVATIDTNGLVVETITNWSESEKWVYRPLKPRLVAHNLEKLVLDIGDDSLFRSVEFPKLQELALLGWHGGAHFETLGGRVASMPVLRSFVAHDGRTLEPQAVLNVVAAAAHTIQSLEVYAPSWEEQSRYDVEWLRQLISCDLRHLKQLEINGAGDCDRITTFPSMLTADLGIEMLRRLPQLTSFHMNSIDFALHSERQRMFYASRARLEQGLKMYWNRSSWGGFA